LSIECLFACAQRLHERSNFRLFQDKAIAPMWYIEWRQVDKILVRLTLLYLLPFSRTDVHY
jgi:hypothetical protein